MSCFPLFSRLFSLSLLSVFVFACTPATQQVERPPNIIIIFADDLGYGDLSSYGHPTIHTPHLDQMAAEGMRFTQFYSGASVCTPSRAALLTGRLPFRSGMASDHRRVLFPNSDGGLPQEEITIAEALKEQGYATSIVGKWHLGHLPPYLPTEHGFDEYFGIPYSNDMSPGTSPWTGALGYPPLPLMEGTEIIEEEPDQTLLTKRYTERAQTFIRTNAEQPFFLYFAHTFPHIPLFASPEFEGTSRRGLYGDVVEELDWSVGQVLQTLREQGIAEHTLVFFTSDNGPWRTVGDTGGSAGLLHDGKGTTWEGGMREPTIAWWPGQIDAGVISTSLGTTMDLLPTALTLAGAPLPQDRVLDGVDFTPVLRQEVEEVRDAVFYYRGTRLFAVRKGPWKLHFITQSAYVGDSPVTHDPPLLHQLERDPDERFNIAEQNPEVVAEILALVEEHRATISPVPSRLETRIYQ